MFFPRILTLKVFVNVHLVIKLKLKKIKLVSAFKERTYQRKKRSKIFKKCTFRCKPGQLLYRSLMVKTYYCIYQNESGVNKNKTGLKPVSRPVERVYYLGGWTEFSKSLKTVFCSKRV